MARPVAPSVAMLCVLHSYLQVVRLPYLGTEAQSPERGVQTGLMGKEIGGQE